MVRSSDGLGGISRTFHKVLRERLMPTSWADHEPSILLNTWETCKCQVDHYSLLEMTKQVSSIILNKNSKNLFDGCRQEKLV
jgi:alpha-galactosidase